MLRTWPALVLLFASQALAAEAAAPDGPWFAPYRTVAEYRPKGPSHCFRQFNIDWSWIARRQDQIPEFLSQADPVALAEFCRQTNLDGTIVMAVPHHGYCTYETRIGQKFPGMKGDWFGRTIEELHKRKIAAFGYVTLNWNWKFMRENLGKDYVHGQMKPDGSFDGAYICLNAPGYVDMVEGYTREVLENYPVDGMRWDILSTARNCTCEGCKAFYGELYGEQLGDWQGIDSRRQWDFYMATTDRAVRRLAGLCRRIKPELEIWQNSIQSYTPNNLNIGRLLSIAYNEYGDPFRLLLLKGVLNKDAAINGLMNRTPTDPLQPIERRAFRLCLILGGRDYSYYGHKQTDHRTLLPGPAMMAWHKENLAPFYQMVEEIQPWLEGTVPVSPIGLVYSENTRFRYRDYDRKAYLDPIEKLTDAWLQRSAPLEFVNALDLADPKKDIGRFRLLVLPQTSGLAGEEVGALRAYAERGGTLLVAGDALRHDPRGAEQADFALAQAMGVHFVRTAQAQEPLRATGQWQGTTPPSSASIREYVEVRPFEGETPWRLGDHGKQVPLLHINRCGRGRVAYLATMDSIELISAAIDCLAGPLPANVSPAGKQAIVTHQPATGRWILHLMDEGDYTVELRREHIRAKRVVGRYPRSGWECRMEDTRDGLRLQVRGDAKDRVLVLE